MPPYIRHEGKAPACVVRLAEIFHDPEDWDLEGRRLWWPLGCRSTSVPFQTETELDHIRSECRQLAVENEFAINGHENRISYVVGTGHRYQVMPRPGCRVPKSILAQAEAVLDRFLRENRWHARQQEIMRRKDRDGEAFLRFFPGEDGLLRVRFVNPEDVRTPTQYSQRPEHSFGIATDPSDVETVQGYWVCEQWVPADQMQHRKANVDANVKRGLPLFYPVRKNLRRAEKLLRNMSTVAGLQSAVALIRKHTGGRSSVERFLHDAAPPVPGEPSASTGYTSVQRFAPGTILDATAGVEYEFPVAAIDAARYVTLLQAELRAVASRLVMPEFMLTSDASNANYASTLVAEGPAVKMFQRLQAEMIEEDHVVLERALQTAAHAGLLPVDVLQQVTIKAVPPSLVVRDRLREAQADAILFRCGALSRETLALRHSLEPNTTNDSPMDESIRGEQRNP
ncbi:MAG: phage portal protein [Thermogutta sp.]